MPWVRRRRRVVWGSTAWTTRQELVAVFALIWAAMCGAGVATGSGVFFLASLFTGGVVAGVLVTVRLGWHSEDEDPCLAREVRRPRVARPAGDGPEVRRVAFVPNDDPTSLVLATYEVYTGFKLEGNVAVAAKDGEPERGDWR
jgi:hypothetical protein